MSKISEKPRIPQSELSRFMEVARLPKGSQDGTRRQIDARRLAKRLRTDEAFYLAGAGQLGPKTWENISDFLGQAIAQGDFKTLDHFCKAWIKYGEHSKPGQAANAAIAAAITCLQPKLGRSPTSSEIISYIEADQYNWKDLKIGKAAVSQFVEQLGLGDCLSRDKRGRRN